MTPLGCILYNTNLFVPYFTAVSACAGYGGGLFAAGGPQDVLALANLTVNLGCENGIF